MRTSITVVSVTLLVLGALLLWQVGPGSAIAIICCALGIIGLVISLVPRKRITGSSGEDLAPWSREFDAGRDGEDHPPPPLYGPPPFDLTTDRIERMKKKRTRNGPDQGGASQILYGPPDVRR